MREFDPFPDGQTPLVLTVAHFDDFHSRIRSDFQNEHPPVPRLGRRVEGRQGVSARQVSVEKVDAAPAAPVAADTPAQQLTPCALRMLS